MKANYLAMDKLDVQWAVRRCAKAMADPKPAGWERIKRVARYLKGRPELKNCMYFSQKSPKLKVQTDGGWAGKEEGRNPIAGGSIYVDGNWIRSWSKDQAKIAKSSAEAELYAANYGAAQALGTQSTMREFGWKVPVELQVDVAATIGTLHRRGLGRMRHLEVEELWLQQELFKKNIDTEGNSRN